MKKHYPLEFTLEDGTHVTVNQTGGDTFSFTLKSKDNYTSQFTYVERDNAKEDAEQFLDFDQLNALRKFWLEA